MHLHRLMALVGVVVGIVGLFFTSLSTDGESALTALSRQSDSFPDGIPTIWGGLAGWAKILLVVLIIATIVIALMGDRAVAYDKTMSAVTAVIGIAMLAYAIVKYSDASDSADTLQAGFAQAAAGGVPGVSAWTVSPSVGFFVLMIGTALVAAGGLLSVIASNQE